MAREAEQRAGRRGRRARDTGDGRGAAPNSTRMQAGGALGPTACCTYKRSTGGPALGRRQRRLVVVVRSMPPRGARSHHQPRRLQHPGWPRQQGSRAPGVQLVAPAAMGGGGCSVSRLTGAGGDRAPGADVSRRLPGPLEGGARHWWLARPEGGALFAISSLAVARLGEGGGGRRGRARGLVSSSVVLSPEIVHKRLHQLVLGRVGAPGRLLEQAGWHRQAARGRVHDWLGARGREGCPRRFPEQAERPREAARGQVHDWLVVRCHAGS